MIAAATDLPGCRMCRTSRTDSLPGSIPSEDFPSWAAQALAKGLDSPALRELAGLPRTEVREGRDLLRSALAELGAVMPSEDAGPEELVIYWASRMAAGTVDPVDGAHWILRQADALGWPKWLNPLHGLASQWDDCVGAENSFEPLAWAFVSEPDQLARVV
jgi:hypothetical protein